MFFFILSLFAGVGSNKAFDQLSLCHLDDPIITHKMNNKAFRLENEFYDFTILEWVGNL